MASSNHSANHKEMAASRRRAVKASKNGSSNLAKTGRKLRPSPDHKKLSTEPFFIDLGVPCCMAGGRAV